MTEAWPAIPYARWKETAAALHLYSQILGKYRLARTPWINHSWHATLYPVPRGLTTGPVQDKRGTIQIGFDFLDHLVVGENSLGDRESFPLEVMSVADMWHRTRTLIEKLGGDPSMHGAPNEVPEATPFAEDTEARPYDGEAAKNFHLALLRVAAVFERFRTGYLGKVSPVHLFWGSFDLAVTRFSGRAAPRHPGGFPNLPDSVTREAYSHEVASAGFWPGGNGADEAMIYAYAYPVPEGYGDHAVEPEAAFFHEDLGEYLLPHEALRTSKQPEADLLAFLHTTYEAAAERGGWNRKELECPYGIPRVPRPMPVI
jgi:hypothetical protein